ncbi:MAG: hypothetical protein ABJG92_03890, partial [Roseibium sp.]|uniref:hypothetical protein n=1 Tax=Roseibium sp. TaxID=1936156 RepID=UPI003299F58B
LSFRASAAQAARRPGIQRIIRAAGAAIFKVMDEENSCSLTLALMRWIPDLRAACCTCPE